MQKNKNTQRKEMAKLTGKLNWFDIDWQKATNQVKQRQIEIAVAYKEDDMEMVSKKQNQLVNSFAAKALAVKTVTTNSGKKTPGIDGVIWNSPEEKLEAILRQNPNSEYKASPVKRVYIPKKNGKLRPLGIPTMADRAMQTLWKLALEPIAECVRDKHSYGYRPFRSTRDLQQFLWLTLSKKHRPNWILEADIKGFFDNIHHQWIMDNIPMDKHILNQFLKAGFMDKGCLHETERGVPQGGSISPTIANMTLDGLTEVVKNEADRIKKNSHKKGRGLSPRVHLVRYADDFVITATSRRMQEGPIKKVVNEFLEKRGLQLSEEKTKITNVKKGFDFVGLNFRIYPFEKGPGGYILLIKPAKANIQRLKEKIKNVVKRAKDWDAVEQISKLNPILMGWANYYRKVVRKKAFKNISHYTWQKIWKWMRVKHPKTSLKALARQYFKKVGNRKWLFYGKKDEKEMNLFQISDTPIVRHWVIRVNKNPYLPEDQAYFAKKTRTLVKQEVWGKRKAQIRKQTGFQCKVCEQALYPWQDTDIHHILPRKMGGQDANKNLMVLHKECHKQVTHTNSKHLLAEFKARGILTTVIES